MHFFQYKGSELYCEDVPLRELAAKVGTPCFVYSKATLARHYRRLESSLDGLEHLICFALKANSNLALLQTLRDLGAGAEAVSGGEIFRALKAGIPPSKIVFDGNGKTPEELSYALDQDILMFNVDCESELKSLSRIAAGKGKTARVALRVNPDIDPKTHPKIATGLKTTKFGLDAESAVELYRAAKDLSSIEIVGIHTHIGSQITELSPFVDLVDRVVNIINQLKNMGIELRYANFGGGVGITYQNEEPPSYEDYASSLALAFEKTGCTVIIEPGRTLVGNAGILLTRVLYIKKSPVKNFVVVDAAMNDLARPSLYGAYHEIIPTVKRDGLPESFVADVVGGICESGDFLAKDRTLPPIKEDDLLAVMSAGAYGSTMSSNYNSRPLIAEVMVDGNNFRVVRRRQTWEEMVSLESL